MVLQLLLQVLGSSIAAATLMLQLLRPSLFLCTLHTGCSPLQPTPAPLPIEGLWGCCTLVLRLPRPVRSSSISAATLMLQLPQPL